MIPSGLQALMEASAVLQQQASQTAPGPQGQQPTVASQVIQQAQQVAQPMRQPQLQAIGRQAGIAGQLMARQQQQQQQMAQNPQAVAQMAAQMLQQKGVAGLPVNMQFKEGGIIGFTEGAEVPDVRTQTIPDRLLAPMDSRLAAERLRARADALKEEEERRRRRRQDLGASYMLTEGELPPAAPPAAARAPRASNIPYAGPDERFAPALAPTSAPRDDQALSAKTIAKPDGIASIAPPRAVMPTPNNIANIMRAIPEDAQTTADIDRIQTLSRQALDARKNLPDLEQQEIDARTRARSQREQLLKSQRERDTFNRLNALFRDLRTWGNEYGAVDRAIDEREKAAIDADLLHEQSVVKLRQAQQARQIGNMDAEASLVKQGMDLRQAEQKRRLEIAKIDIEVDKVRVAGEQREATSYADRVNALQLKLADLANREELRRDQKLRDQYTAASDKLGRQQAALEKQVREKFGTYISMRNVPGSKPDPVQERAMQDYIKELTETMITPLERIVDDLAAKVLGTSVATPRPTSRGAVDFSKLPTK